MRYLDKLERRAALRWRADEHAWVGDHEAVVRVLADEGFQEYKRETARGKHARLARGGMWQGLDQRTGAVATVIWVVHTTPPETHVFVEVDGQPIEGSAWTEIDDAVLHALEAGGGRLALADIAGRVGMSEDAVRSVVSMLAEQGKVRIAAVELPHLAPTVLPRRPLAPVAPSRSGGAAAAS
jgi:hypothetical protein